jgi:hypothetical protein
MNTSNKKEKYEIAALNQVDEADFLIFTTPDGKVNVEAYYYGDTIWVTQKRLAVLFGVDRSVIGKHLKNIFEAGELNEDTVCAIFAHTAADGKTYNTKYYDLDAVISVGYRVNSIKATEFRKWATAVLNEYMIKGFALDDERLKNGSHFGKNYFKELLERIREIRISERQLYLQITDIFALASDYDKESELTRLFFTFIQNKLHYAITGQTAAELTYSRADSTKPHMGLTNWKYSPDGKILKSDITIGKNYLNKDELHKLRLAVTAFLDIAEARAERRIITDMEQWIKIMNGYLDLNEYPILQGYGTISRDEADRKANEEYAEFRIRQDREYLGDFEKSITNWKNEDMK